MSVPKTMKALQIAEQGGFDVLKTKQIDVPSPGPKDILIKVEYAGVNYIDTYQRSGLYKLKMPHVLGQEGAGTVVGLGSEVVSDDIKIGDRVATYQSGAFAEYLVAPRSKAAKLPVHVDSKLGAAAILQGLTAWTMVREAFPVKKGDWILVHAAAGGTGTLLCQMASYLGAHVIGTASTPEKIDIAKKNGAEFVINYTQENLVDRVKEITKNVGVHAILDGVGKDTWEGETHRVQYSLSNDYNS